MPPDEPTPASALRVAAAADVADLVALVQSAYRGAASRGGWTTEADLLDGQRTDPEAVAALIGTPGSLVLIADGPATGDAGRRATAAGATGGGAPVACCHLADRGAGLAALGMVAVAPAHQADGLGRWLLAAAEAVAADRLGARAVEMTVIAQRAELLAWYARRGYAPTGERRPFPYGDERFGVPRRDDLEFVVLRRELGAPPGRPAPRP